MRRQAENQRSISLKLQAAYQCWKDRSPCMCRGGMFLSLPASLPGAPDSARPACFAQAHVMHAGRAVIRCDRPHGRLRTSPAVCGSAGGAAATAAVEPDSAPPGDAAASASCGGLRAGPADGVPGTAPCCRCCTAATVACRSAWVSSPGTSDHVGVCRDGKQTYVDMSAHWPGSMVLAGPGHPLPTDKHKGLETCSELLTVSKSLQRQYGGNHGPQQAALVGLMGQNSPSASSSGG